VLISCRVREVSVLLVLLENMTEIYFAALITRAFACEARSVLSLTFRGPPEDDTATFAYDLVSPTIVTVLPLVKHFSLWPTRRCTIYHPISPTTINARQHREKGWFSESQMHLFLNHISALSMCLQSEILRENEN